ncbi:DUF1549 domain-containing protein [Gemmata sp.]|uniref:DUF1549 domain-containing protein n=1 Tax=Gemmata sp. TaxID=1914242 RepID=UPI003F712216
MLRTTLTGFALLIGFTARAAEPRPAAEVAKQIDAAIDQHLAASKMAPAPQSGDAEFLRRAYLDVTGRVPTAKQAAAFLDSTGADKRTKLIDELLALPNYGDQFGRTWRDWIAPPELPSDVNSGKQPLAATRNLGNWFAARFNADDGWDVIVRKVLTADGTLKDQPQGMFFSLAGDDTGRPSPGGATRVVGSLFLGLQLQCAECHKDPFKDYKQSDYWGLAAFFRNVSWKFQGSDLEMVTEATAPAVAAPKAKPGAKGGLQFNPDKAPFGSITIPAAALRNSGTVIPGKFPEGAKLVAERGVSLRSVIADWLTARENPYFARAFVNRTWAYFFARGIVNPIDDLRSDNPPSHPELLDLLTEEFVASGYKVKHLVRCVTATNAYRRTSRPAKTDAPGLVAKFGRMPVKVLTADALYDSLRLAFAEPVIDLRSYNPKEAGGFGESSPVGSAFDEFAKLFVTNEDDATDFTHGIPQLLALTNHPRLRSGGKAIDDMVKAKFEPAAAVQALYLATLSRRPTAQESADALAYIAGRGDPRKGYCGVLWMLVNRTEFLVIR